MFWCRVGAGFGDEGFLEVGGVVGGVGAEQGAGPPVGPGGRTEGRVGGGEQGGEGDGVGDGEVVRVGHQLGEGFRAGGVGVPCQVGAQVGVGEFPVPVSAGAGGDGVQERPGDGGFDLLAACLPGLCRGGVGRSVSRPGSPRRWAASSSWKGRKADRWPGPRSSTT